MMCRLALLIGLGLAILFAPTLWLRITAGIVPITDAQPAEAALIFGAMVRGGTISPLHKERLDTGLTLLNAGTVDTLVVSNARNAARAMQNYLIDSGVPEDQIEVDPLAIHTPDTCRAEHARNAPRKVILISQKFHLPRIALQCAKYTLDSQLVFADNPNRAALPVLTTLRIRMGRILREAFLTWGAILGLYPES